MEVIGDESQERFDDGDGGPQGRCWASERCAGLLQADAYAGFNPLYAPGRVPVPVIEALCWSHGRRKFYELVDIAAGKRRGKGAAPISPAALEVVKRVDALFDTEREISGESAERRLTVRRERSALSPPSGLNQPMRRQSSLDRAWRLGGGEAAMSARSSATSAVVKSRQTHASQGPQMLNCDAVLIGQPLGDQRAVAGLWVALDTEQRCGPTNRQCRHDRREVDTVEDLGGVAAGVLDSEFAARSLADPAAVILGVLELA